MVVDAVHWSRAREVELESPAHERRPSPAAPRGAGEAPPDVALAVSARAGDRDAFGRLYERHARWVHGLLVARVPRRDADDLLQEVFLSALRSIAKLGDPERFAGWLGSIARNLASDALRRRALRASELAEDLPERPGPGPDPADARASDELLAQVRELPEAYRETLVLRLVEGLSGPQIARRTGLTHGSVRVNLHRGMRLLREKLAENGWS